MIDSFSYKSASRDETRSDLFTRSVGKVALQIGEQRRKVPVHRSESWRKAADSRKWIEGRAKV